MFDDLIITGTDKIIKFLRKLDIDIFLTTPQIKHVIAFICAMMLKGYNGKVSDVSELALHRHRGVGFKIPKGTCYRSHMETIRSHR
jgi:energy-converting hydrogenase Eha subunit G